MKSVLTVFIHLIGSYRFDGGNRTGLAAQVIAGDKGGDKGKAIDVLSH